MSIDFERDNPYRSARFTGPGVLLERELVPGAKSRLLSSGLLYRRIQVEAPIQATVEFHGRSLWDVVKVDGQIAAAVFSWYRITPRFEFAVAATGRELPVVVEMRLGRFLRIKGFRLLVDGAVVYREGTG